MHSHTCVPREGTFLDRMNVILDLQAQAEAKAGVCKSVTKWIQL